MLVTNTTLKHDSKRQLLIEGSSSPSLRNTENCSKKKSKFTNISNVLESSISADDKHEKFSEF